MKIRSSIFLGLFFVVGAQSQITACAPTDDSGGSGGATSAGGSGTGGLVNGAGGAGSGGDATGSGGVQAVGIGGTAPALTCGTGAGGTSPALPATFATFQQIVADYNCSSSDCHGIHADLVLKGTPDEVYQNLIDTASEECGGLKAVQPNDPDASALVRLLKGGCGTLKQMPNECGCDVVPYINNCLRADEVIAVEEWVRSGALK